jgi:P27 family predicted phage terminase small subunit
MSASEAKADVLLVDGKFDCGSAWIMRGRKPVPTHLKLLRGNPAKRELGSEPQPERLEQPSQAPAFLLPEAKAEWKRLAPELVELGLLTSLDLQTFAIYCQAFGRAEQAERIFAETGGALTIRGARGGEIVNPLLRIARDAGNEAMRIGAEFGLSPLSRLRLTGIAPPKPPSKFNGLIG